MQIIKSILKKTYEVIPLKQTMYTLLKTVYTPSHEMYKHLHFKGWFRAKAGGTKFWMYHHGYELENQIYWEGVENGWERVSADVWIKLSGISQVIIDVGANTGIYALLSKSVNPGSRVFAYEPVQRVFKKLVTNVAKNKFDIHAQEIALSNYDGEAVIYDQPTEHIYSVTVNKNMVGTETKVIPTTISTKKLATIIKEEKLERLDLIKIDVETHETEVLEGLEEYLLAYQPILLFEILNDEVAKNVNSILDGKNYVYYAIDENSGLIKIHTIHFYSNKKGYNYLAFPVSKKKEIERVLII